MSWTDAEHHCAKQGGHLAMAGVSDISTSPAATDSGVAAPPRRAATFTIRGDGSRRRRGDDVESPRETTARGDAAAMTTRGAATTWIVRGRRVAATPPVVWPARRRVARRYVGARVPDDGCRELWIGLNDRAVAGAYAWVGADDGDDVADDFVINLQTTSPGSADGSCVFVGVGCQAEVVAAACDEERSFVCRLSGASLEACAAAPDDVPSLRGFGGAEGSGGADDAPPLRAPGRRLRGADKKTTPSATKHTGS